MSISSLLISRCSWRRKQNAGSNEFNEIMYTDVTIGSDVKCSRQIGIGMNMRQLLKDYALGDVNKKLVKYYMLPTDIQEGDIIEFEGSETERVRDVKDAGGRGHHLEIIAESIVQIGEGDGRIG